MPLSGAPAGSGTSSPAPSWIRLMRRSPISLGRLLARYSMAIKSLVVRVEVDTAGRAHNCQANTKHRIKKGDKHQKEHKNKSRNHYCRACAETIIARDITKLAALRNLTPMASQKNDNCTPSCVGEEDFD